MKKRYERNHFKAFSNSINKKKLYKKGKEWVIGSLTLLAMTGMGVAVDHTIHADTNAKPATTSVGSTADIENRATALYNHVVANNAVSNNADQGQQTQKKTMRLGASNGNSNVLNYYQQNGYLDPSSNKIEPKYPNVIDYTLKNNDGNPVSQNTIYGPDHYATGTPQDQKVYQKMNTPGFQQYLENDAQNRFNRIKAANDDESFTEYFIASDFPRRGNSDMPNGLGDAAHAIAITSDDPSGRDSSGIISKEVNDYRNAYNKAHGLPTSDTNYKFDYVMDTHGAQVGYAYQWAINKVYISIPPRMTVNYTYNGKVISTPFDQQFMYRNWYYNSQNPEGSDNFDVDNYMDFYNINEDGNNRTRELASYREVPSDIDENKDYWDINHFNSDKVYYSDWKDVPAVPDSILKTLPNGYQYTFKLTHSDLSNYGSQVQQVSDYQNSYTYPDAPQYDKSFVINIPLTLNARNTSLKLNNVVTFVDKKTGKPIGQWVSKDKGYRKDFDNDLYQFYLNISNPNNYYKSNIVLPNGYVLSGSDASKFQNYIYPPTGYVNGRFNYGANYTIPLGKPAGNTITYLFNGKPVGKWTSPTTGEVGTKDNDLVNVYSNIQSDSAPGMPTGYYIKSSDLNNFLNAVWPTQNNSSMEANYGRDFKINVTSWSHVHVYFEDADTGANLMSEVKPGYSDFKSYVDSPFDINSDVPGYQSLFNDLGYHYVGMMHPASSFDGNPGEVHTIDLLYAPNTTTNDYAPVEDTVHFLSSGTDSALSSAAHNVTEYSRSDVNSASSANYGHWLTTRSLGKITYPSMLAANGSYYHEVNADTKLPTDNQIQSSLNNSASNHSASFDNNVYYAADSVINKPESANATKTTYYYWNNGKNNVSSASMVSTYNYSRSASYDTEINSYVSSVGSWSVIGSVTSAAQNSGSNGGHLVGSYGNLPDSSAIVNNLVPGKTASYANYVIYAPDSVCNTKDYGVAKDTVNYLVNGTGSALTPSSASVLIYSHAASNDHTTGVSSASDWKTSDNFSQVNVPQTITSNGVTYHVVNANSALPTYDQVTSSLNQAQPGSTASASFTNNVYYAPAAPDNVITQPEFASAVETINYYWNNGGQTVSSASTVSTYSYSRSASYDTNLNRYVGSVGSWSVTGSTRNAAQNTSLSGYQFASSFGILPSDNTIENNLKPGQTVSYVNNRIYGPDSVNSAQNYGIATDTVNYLINGTSSAVSSASSSVRFYSQSDVNNHTTSANSLGNWRTNVSFSSINAPQMITSNGVTYHQVSADLTLPSDAQVISSLNQTRSGNSASASFANNVYYAPDSVSAKPESASATTTTYYYWDNGPNNVSSASTVSTYNYGRSASYDSSMNSYVGPFTNWSLANSSVSATANSGANGDRLVGSYGSVPDQATIMNSLMAGRNTSYANYVIYAPDSVCDTHDYTSATDTVKYLVSGTSSAVSPTSSSIRFYSRADVMDHTTNHASVSDWKTNGNFSNVNVPQTIVSGGVTYSAVSANVQLPSVAQGSLTAKTANYENDVYYAPVTAKLTVNYVDTTNGNVVKSADAGTMNNGSQWTVSQDYFNQVPNNYTLDNNYDNNANAQLLRTPITVTTNGSSTANVYVKPVQTQQPSGPITVHYVTSDSQPVQVNGKAVSDVKFTGQPLNDAQLETPINGYNPVGVMGNLNYTNYPQDVYVVYKPTQNVTRGHIHVRFVDDSNHQREFWSDKFSDKTGAAFDLREDNYANRYLPGYHFDNNVTGNTNAYGNDPANDPHVIVVGYTKVPSDDEIAVPQSAVATKVVNYLADKNGSLSPLTASTSQSVAFSGNGSINTKTRQFSSATSWSTDQHFSSASVYSSAGWSLFSSANDIPASVAPGGSYVEDLYYKLVSASSTTPAPSSKAGSASSSAKPSVSSSSVAPSSMTPQSMPSVSSVAPSSSLAQPARRSTQAVTKNSSSDVAPSYMKPAHQRVITKKNTKSLMNQLSKLIHHNKHGMTRRQTKLYRKISRKLNRAEYDGIHEARRRTEGLRVHVAVTKRERGHAVRQNVRGLHSHSTKVRRQLKLRQATNAKDQRKGAKKLPQTGEAQSYSALYAMLFVISAVILADLGKAVDKRRHE